MIKPSNWANAEKKLTTNLGKLHLKSEENPRNYPKTNKISKLFSNERQIKIGKSQD